MKHHTIYTTSLNSFLTERNVLNISIIPALLIFISLFIFQNNLKSQTILNKIVIDAGHGGKDPGASGKYSREKDVVLAIALKTGQLIKKKYPDVEIIYTRKTDVFITLKKRAEIANKNKADLFISIHCNSNTSSQPHGSETYVMGLHKSAANLSVAQKENAAILLEDDYKEQYDGFDPTTDESHIIFNFFQNSFSSHNLDLATKMQSEFTVSTPLKNRGVKQAGFWVLYKTTMPGVLLETGFLSNKADESFLNSQSGQLKLSQAITKAVSDYKEAHDAIEKEKLTHKTPTAANVKAEKETEKKEIASVESKQVNSAEPKPTEKKKETLNTKVKKTQNSIEPKSNLPVFKVQFLSLSSKKTLSAKKYTQLPKISSYKYKGLYRYTSGATSDYSEAISLQSEVRKQGFTDAFIIAFFEGERISLKEAKAMIK